MSLRFARYTAYIAVLSIFSVILCDKDSSVNIRSVLTTIELNESTLISYGLGDSNRLVHINTDVDETICLQGRFCSQCAKWSLCPTDEQGIPLGDCFSNKNSGNILHPQEINGTIDSNYFSMEYKGSRCNFEIVAFKDPECSFKPNVPFIENKNIKEDRESSFISLHIQPATCEEDCTLRYNIYKYTGMAIDTQSKWCDLETYLNEGIFRENFTVEVDQLEYGVVEVAVKNMETGAVSFYDRVLIEQSLTHTALRVTANVLAPLIVLIPAVILFTGYHRRFRAKKLVFNYINFMKPTEQEYTDEHLVDTMTRQEIEEDASKSEKRAKSHTTVFLIIQLICHVIIIVLASTFRNFMSLHLIVSLIAIPAVILGGISVYRFPAQYILGYMVSILWIMSMQVAIMQIYINIGDNILGPASRSFDEWPIIITQFLTAIASVFSLLSLSPTAFLYSKLTGDSVHPERTFPTLGRAIVIFVYVNIIVTLAWIGVSMYYLTYTLPGESIDARPFISAHIQVAFALYSLFAAKATLYSSKTFAIINTCVLGISIPYSLAQLISDAVIEWHEIINIIDSNGIATGIIYTLRIMSLLMQIVLLVLSLNFYKRLKSEPVRFIVSKLNPLFTIKRLGALKSIVLCISILECIGAFITIIFDITGDQGFPSVHLIFYCFILAMPSTAIGLWTQAPHYLFYGILMDVASVYLWVLFLKNLAWLPLIVVHILKVLIIISLGIIDFFSIRKKQITETESELDDIQSSENESNVAPSPSLRQIVKKRSKIELDVKEGSEVEEDSEDEDTDLSMS